MLLSVWFLRRLKGEKLGFHVSAIAPFRFFRVRCRLWVVLFVTVTKQLGRVAWSADVCFQLM